MTHEESSAQAEFAANAAQRHDALIEGNYERLDELDRDATRLSRVMERAQVALPELRARLARANYQEDQERKRAMRAAALAKRKKAKATAFPKVARASFDLRDGMVEIADSELAIQESNANLPDGEEPIVGLEQEVRGLPAIPSRVIEEKVEDVWVYSGYREMVVPREKWPLIKTATACMASSATRGAGAR